jgi:hypothetical protein
LQIFEAEFSLGLIALHMHSLHQKLSSLSASDWAAWWGAILATIVFGWDIVKSFRSGPRLRVRAAPEMQMEDGRGALSPEKYITLKKPPAGEQANGRLVACATAGQIPN